MKNVGTRKVRGKGGAKQQKQLYVSVYKNTPRETGFVPLRAPNSVAGVNPGEFLKLKTYSPVAITDFCKPPYLDKRQPPEQDIAAFAIVLWVVSIISTRKLG